MCAGFGGLEHVHRSAHSCWTFSCAVRFSRFVRSLWLACFPKETTIIKGSLDAKLPSYELLKMLKETDQKSNRFVK